MKSTMPLVSVIIPIYNVENYLPQCLNSVINQTYQNLEILLIDDGSTDGCGKICDEYAKRDARIRVIHTENNGLATARNIGIQNAAGIYLSFLDSDDWAELNMIEIMLNTAITEKADIVTAKAYVESVGKTRTNQYKTLQTQIFEGRDILSAYAAGNIGNAVWNKLYRMNCFDGIRFPDGRNYEDVSTTWKVLSKLATNGGKIAVLPNDLFHFRHRRSSITHTKSYKNIFDRWTAYSEIYAAFPEYQKRFLPECYYSMGMMWINYSGFTSAEKDLAKKGMQEMQSFSRIHFRDVIKGKYPTRAKITAILLMSKWSPLMRCYYEANRIRRSLKGIREKMYE